MEEKQNIILQSLNFSFSHGFDVYAGAQLVRIFVMNVENKCNKLKHVHAKRCYSNSESKQSDPVLYSKMTFWFSFSSYETQLTL